LSDRAKDAEVAASTPLRGGWTTNDVEDRGLVFERIKGAIISQSIGSRLALTILMEIHGGCMMHFSAIFITEVDGFYRDILGKSGAPQAHTARERCG
jgi:hypothetical protein